MNNKTILTGLCGLLAAAGAIRAQSTAFTYQGRLNSVTGAATGLYDFSFNLYAASGGGSALTASNGFFAVPVTGGVFTVTLDFGNQFPGADRWLGTAVRTNGAGAFATLTPRQPLAPTPYAIRAASAGTATTATTANSVVAGAVNGTALAANSVDSSKIADGSITANDLSSALLSNTFWRLTGNAGTSAGVNFVGTTDDQPFEARVNNRRVLRFEVLFDPGNSPNLIGGFSGNSVSGVFGAAIGGGGAAGFPNRVNANYGVVAGGLGNSVFQNDSFIGGGIGNNISTDRAVIAGGRDNSVRTNASNAAIGGGRDNVITGAHGAIPGGISNQATNNAFAAGTRAKAIHSGTFVWADSQNSDFSSSSNNQFLVRASGGAGFGTTTPTAQLDVSSTGGDSFPQLRIDHTTGSDYARLRFTQRGNYNHRWDLGAISNSFSLYSGYFGREFLHGDSNGVSFGDSNVGIGTTSPLEKLHVAGRFLRVDGLGDERAYLGGDGNGGEVQVGSLNPAINNVLLWNAGNNTTMDLIADQITANQFSGAFLGDGSGLNNVWKTGGNAGMTTGVNFLGTSDNQELHLRSFNRRGLLLARVSAPVPRSGLSRGSDSAMNVAGGYWGNVISSGVIGATIAGGGYEFDDNIFNPPVAQPNVVTGDYGAVGGGAMNTAGYSGTVPGGLNNAAAGRYSFAAGRQAKANHDGSFVWADSQNGDFSSTTTNEFAIRAAGGLRLDTVGGTEQMRLNSAGRLTVGGDFLVARGTGNEQGYIGGDGAGGNVQVGSLNSSIMTVELFNTVNGFMDLTARDASVRSLTIRGGADLAEPFPMKDVAIEPGSVVVIDDEHPGQLKLSGSAYDTRVAGIVSGAGGVQPGIALHQEGVFDAGKNVALSGRVYVKADATSGAIRPGDLLTTSARPGHAMKVTDSARSQGAILGKAMSALAEGKGLVLVLVTLQ